MAGKEKNGYGVSEAELYKGASFIITPCGADEKYVNTLADLALSIGFGQVKITTPEEHDRMIAFTSQLPHVLACSYVLSPCCPNHNGFSAGSYLARCEHQFKAVERAVFGEPRAADYRARYFD